MCVDHGRIFINNFNDGGILVTTQHDDDDAGDIFVYVYELRFVVAYLRICCLTPRKAND